MPIGTAPAWTLCTLQYIRTAMIPSCPWPAGRPLLGGADGRRPAREHICTCKHAVTDSRSTSARVPSVRPIKLYIKPPSIERLQVQITLAYTHRAPSNWQWQQVSSLAKPKHPPISDGREKGARQQCRGRGRGHGGRRAAGAALRGERGRRDVQRRPGHGAEAVRVLLERRAEPGVLRRAEERRLRLPLQQLLEQAQEHALRQLRQGHPFRVQPPKRQVPVDGVMECVTRTANGQLIGPNRINPLHYPVSSSSECVSSLLWVVIVDMIGCPASRRGGTLYICLCNSWFQPMHMHARIVLPYLNLYLPLLLNEVASNVNGLRRIFLV